MSEGLRQCLTAISTFCVWITLLWIILDDVRS